MKFEIKTSRPQVVWYSTSEPDVYKTTLRLKNSAADLFVFVLFLPNSETKVLKDSQIHIYFLLSTFLYEASNSFVAFS